MEALVRHLVEPIVEHEDDISVQVVKGDSVVMLELVVHPDDRDRVKGDGGRTIRSIRTILSAAAGRKKATVDLVDEHSLGDEE